MRKLSVLNITGHVVINAVVKGYYSKMFGHPTYTFAEIEPLNLGYEVKD